MKTLSKKRFKKNVTELLKDKNNDRELLKLLREQKEYYNFELYNEHGICKMKESFELSQWAEIHKILAENPNHEARIIRTSMDALDFYLNFKQ